MPLMRALTRCSWSSLLGSPLWKNLQMNNLQTVFALMLAFLVGGLLFGFAALRDVEYCGTRYSKWNKTTSFQWSLPSKKDSGEDWDVRSGNYTPLPWRAEYMGQVNLHVFDDWCGSSMDSLRKNVHYPLHPHVRTTVKKLALAPQQFHYGLRLFGYIHPPIDGEYIFALSSDDNSELWLSTDHSPLNLLLRAWIGKTGAEWTAPGEYDKYIDQKSAPIRLSSQMKYFFEVIYKQNKDIDHVAVAWQLLNHTQNFEIIQSDHISLYVDESSKVMGDIAHIPQTAASHKLRHGKKQRIVPDMQKEDLRDTLYQVPMVNSSLVSGLLPDCEYNPSYTLKGQKLQRYQGLSCVHLSYIYPNDHTRLTHMNANCYYSIKPDTFANTMVLDSPIQKTKHIDYQGQKSHALNMNCKMTGNLQAQETEVKSIVRAYMDRITQRHGHWTLVHVANVVLNVDLQKGRRYLVELLVRDETGTLRRLSEYIYAQRTSGQSPEPPKLCYPTGFRWNPQATVHFVLTVKNQAKWVHLLIKDVETLVRETGDANFNLILTDFNSSDMNVEQALAKSRIPRYQYKKLNGNFERSRGLQEGINLMEDPHSIIFLFDLHVRFPFHIIDLLRKHCVEGHQAVAPIVMRLECGASPLDARGFWEVYGFGLLGIYKSDMEKAGGMNTRDFKDHWGGEDWELLDRLVMSGLEVERFYMRNFYHHFHSKQGMWLTNHR